ncbi:MAG TPA: site-2 protease family protein [Pyrinomonadaceae bacterium]|jgi:membrane-associated protease RseP (regulator of RpoE activity)
MLITYVLLFAATMFIHELGHLAAARLCGVRAPELGLGWGPKLFEMNVRGVRFKMHLLPVGAYVRLDMKELQARPLVQQVFVLLAGVLVNIAAALATQGSWFSLMNFLLAATNLLPLYQQDGWKCGMVMLRALLARRSSLVEWTFTVAGAVVSFTALASLALRYF